MKITSDLFTVECYQNGEATDFRRGWRVHGAPGHNYYAEHETLEEAQECMRGLRRDFFMAHDYDRVTDELGEAKAKEELEAFVANGVIDDDLNFYGIRRWTRFAIGEDGVARILADREDENFNAAIAALKEFDAEIDPMDWRDAEGNDENEKRDTAATANAEALNEAFDGDALEVAKVFREVVG